MARRRVIFRKGAAPAAAPVALVSVRMPAAPVMFVKAVTPSPSPSPAPESAHAAALVEPDEFNWGRPCTSRMVDILVKSTHDGLLSATDLSRASDAYMCLKPLPHDLIGAVLAGST
jgi:hypothetical protein